MKHFSTLSIVSVFALSLGLSQAAFAVGMDGHWSGMLNGEKGSGQADIVVTGKNVTYSYQQSSVPVEWAKVNKSRVYFGNKNYKLTLWKNGSAKFSSPQYGSASGTLSRQ
jgi:hypothetical protein